MRILPLEDFSIHIAIEFMYALRAKVIWSIRFIKNSLGTLEKFILSQNEDTKMVMLQGMK